MSDEEIVRWTTEGSLPVYRQQPGFIAYEVIQAEGDTWISVTTWESREQADAGAQRIAVWLKETPTMVSLVRSRDHQWIGNLAYSTREP